MNKKSVNFLVTIHTHCIKNSAGFVVSLSVLQFYDADGFLLNLLEDRLPRDFSMKRYSSSRPNPHKSQAKSVILKREMSVFHFLCYEFLGLKLQLETHHEEG
jgi:hypothetical protein